MKKLFVSVPMKGRTEEAIRNSIAKMKKVAEAYEGEELELIDSYIEDKPPVDGKTSVWYLAKSIEKLVDADVLITVSEAYMWSGCYIESEVAGRYGIKVYRVDEDIVLDDFEEIRRRMYANERVPVGE